MISGIIMASGFSKRMEQEKLTLEIEGSSLIEKTIELAKSSRLGEIILVYRREVVKEIAVAYGIKTVFNPEAHLGQSRAMAFGINASNPNSHGYMFLMGDQPFLKVSFINKLIDEFHGESQILVPRYGGRRGSPVIFSSQLKNRLLSIEGDEGGRGLIQEMPEVVKFVDTEDAIMGQDIDTWEMYQQILGNR